MIGAKIISFKTIDSTNNYIKNHQADLEDGTIIVSKQQTQGRGRGNHVWESDLGNLYFSFIQKKDISYGNIFSLLSRVCVTIINVLAQYNVHASIKYPNDILIKNKKISGILIETYGNLLLESLIVGIGINVNQIQFGSLQNKATSLQLETDKKVDLDELLQLFIQEYNKSLVVDDMSIFDEYLKHSIVLGKGIDYQGTKYKINTISNRGELLLKSESENKRLQLNEISLEELYDE